MGNDGGSIPKRRELVKEAARNPSATELKESMNEQQEYLWNTDPLSQRPLERPVVSDALGRLFNKDAVIEFLLPAEDATMSKRVEQEEFVKGTIKSLKDVVEVKFEVENPPNGNATAKRGGTGRTERWVCPVTKTELGPGAKAVYLVPCGHAFSGVAVQEVSGEQCLQCNETYASNDIIPILPTIETDVARLTLRMRTLKESGLTHSLKKVSGSGKKRKKNGPEAAELEVKDAPSPDSKQINAPTSTSKGATPQPVGSAGSVKEGIKNAATASLTAKVLEEQEERNKRRRTEKNENLESLFSHSNASSGAKKGRDIDFMNRGYAIPGTK